MKINDEGYRSLEMQIKVQNSKNRSIVTAEPLTQGSQCVKMLRIKL
jgi:hypothetical protein